MWIDGGGQEELDRAPRYGGEQRPRCGASIGGIDTGRASAASTQGEHRRHRHRASIGGIDTGRASAASTQGEHRRHRHGAVKLAKCAHSKDCSLPKWVGYYCHITLIMLNRNRKMLKINSLSE